MPEVSLGFFGAGTISMTESTNNGNVGKGSHVGGLVGCAYGDEVGVTISNCTNNGSVTGNGEYVGGFFGYMFSQMTTEVTVINSANKADVSAGTEIACGLFCTAAADVESTVLNCVNKGNVKSQKKGYGITPIVTEARNVVNIGDVADVPESHTFWKQSQGAELFFGLKINPQKDGKGQLIKFNNTEKYYELNEGGSPLHELLSNEAVNKKYGMVWSGSLDIVFKPVVYVTGELKGFIIVDPGTELGDVKNFSGFIIDDDNYGVVNGDNKTRVIYQPNHQVFADMTLIIGRWVRVSVGAPFHRTEKMVAGEKLERLAQILSTDLDDFIIVNNTGDILNELWTVETSVSLRFCHNLTVSGTVNLSGHFEHGTPLAQISNLSELLTNSSFIIFSTSDPETVFHNNISLDEDMDITILKVNKQEIILGFDGQNNTQMDDIKNAIMDVIVIPDDEHLWLDVDAEGDGSFRVTVIQTEGVTDSVSDLLNECI